VNDGGSGDVESSDDEKDVVGRIFAHPFKYTEADALRGLGLGVAASYGNQEGALRNYASAGQQRFFGYRSGAGTAAAPNVVADGSHWRLSPQLYYYWGPLGIFGEYIVSDQRVRRDAGGSTFARLGNTGW
jgi:phosphate-selective porin OprO/OprP